MGRARTHDLPFAKRDHYHYTTVSGEVKCNQACAENQTVNEHIKHPASKLVNVYVQFFNIVFDSGILPYIWLKDV
jgi:hypothetical protein